MLPNYEDILSRIAEPPRWFDEQGVPRYCEFAPHHIANIYANECALLAIECQSCGRPFIVALDAAMANHKAINPKGREWRTLADIIRSHQIEYGTLPMWSAVVSGATQNEHSPAACSNIGSVFRKPIQTPPRACAASRGLAIGRATTALKSRYRRGNRCSP